MKHLRTRTRHSTKSRRPGPPRAGHRRLLPRLTRDRDAPAPAFDPPRRHIIAPKKISGVLVSLGVYLVLWLGMNCCFPFNCP